MPLRTWKVPATIKSFFRKLIIQNDSSSPHFWIGELFQNAATYERENWYLRLPKDLKTGQVMQSKDWKTWNYGRINMLKRYGPD